MKKRFVSFLLVLLLIFAVNLCSCDFLNNEGLFANSTKTDYVKLINDVTLNAVKSNVKVVNTNSISGSVFFGSGSIIKISSDIKIRINYDKLVFFNEKEEIKFCYELRVPGSTYIPEINKKITTKIVDSEYVPEKYSDKNKCFFDIEKTGKKLYVRNKQIGDSIFLTGMDGKKSIKKFFSDLKIDADLRDKIPLIVNDDDVLWVVGYRTNKKYLISNVLYAKRFWKYKNALPERMCNV